MLWGARKNILNIEVKKRRHNIITLQDFKRRKTINKTQKLAYKMMD